MTAELVPVPLVGELVVDLDLGVDDERWVDRDPEWLVLRADVDEFLSEFKSRDTKLAYANHLGCWWDPITREDRVERVPDMLNGLAWFTVCRGARVHPYDAPRRLVVHWLELLAQTPQRRGQNMGRPLSQATRSSALAAVKSLYDFAIEEKDRMQCTPVTINRRRAELQLPNKSTTRSLSEAEFLAMLAAADRFEPVDLRPRAKALIAFKFTAGARVSETCNLRRSDFRIDGGQRIADLTVKGDKPHTVPVHDWVWKLLVDYWTQDTRAGGQDLALVGDITGSSAPAFYTRTGRPMARQSVTALLQHVATIAGLENPEEIGPHVARHTVADEAERLDVPITEVQKLLNHANLSTTGRYGNRNRGYAASPALVIGNRIAQQTA
jgi:integrase